MKPCIQCSSIADLWARMQARKRARERAARLACCVLLPWALIALWYWQTR